MIYESYIDKTIYEMLELIERQYGKRTVFSYQDESSSIRQVTYTRLWTDVRRLAEYFNRRNLKKRYIVISARNTYEQVIAMLAASSMGAVAVMLNFDLSFEDLQYALGKAVPSLIVYDETDQEFVQDYQRKNGVEAICCTMGDSSVRGILASDMELYVQEADISAIDPTLVLMTSGSGSRSKLVLIPHHLFIPSHAEIYSDGEKTILLYPLFHIAAFVVLIGCMARGCNICLSSMKTGFMDIQWFHPNTIKSVPMFVHQAVKRMQEGESGYEHVTAIHGGGAPLDAETSQFLLKKNIFSASMYGCTELGSITISLPSSNKPGSVGKPGPWNQVHISEQGEILVKGKNQMLEYIGEPEATKRALEGGWYHTGDVGYLDEDGFLFITGRLDNRILFSNGENVSPEAIEAKLSRCAAVEEILVYGEKERIKARIWCGKNPSGAAREAVQEAVDDYNRTVPLYQQIREVVFSQEPLPRTASGKIKRHGGSAARLNCCE